MPWEAHAGQLVAGHDQECQAGPADEPIGKEVPDPLVDGQEALVEGDVEAARGGLPRGHHLVGLGEGVGDGLVGDDVLARCEGLQGHRMVQVVGQANVRDLAVGSSSRAR